MSYYHKSSKGLHADMRTLFMELPMEERLRDPGHWKLVISHVFRCMHGTDDASAWRQAFFSKLVKLDLNEVIATQRCLKMKSKICDGFLIAASS